MSHLPLATAIALLATVSIAGCAPETPGGVTPTLSDPTPASPSATPPADGDPMVDPNVLFTISVTATAPNGAVAHLTQTVYKPVATTTQQSTDEAALDTECDGWRGSFASPEYLVSLIDVTDQSPEGASWEHSVAVASMNGWPVFSGEVDTFQSYCASYQVNLGASRAVTPVAAGSGSDDMQGWARIQYGFGIATEAGSDTPGPDDTVLSDCTIELSAEAATSAIASAWAWDGNPLSCSFGNGAYGA